jgi:hypothetical protein
MKCSICNLEHEKQGIEYCFAASQFEIQRLTEALNEIRFSGNNNEPRAIYLQQLAAHAVAGYPKPKAL